MVIISWGYYLPRLDRVPTYLPRYLPGIRESLLSTPCKSSRTLWHDETRSARLFRWSWVNSASKIWTSTSPRTIERPQSLLSHMTKMGEVRRDDVLELDGDGTPTGRKYPRAAWGTPAKSLRSLLTNCETGKNFANAVPEAHGQLQ